MRRCDRHLQEQEPFWTVRALIWLADLKLIWCLCPDERSELSLWATNIDMLCVCHGVYSELSSWDTDTNMLWMTYNACSEMTGRDTDIDMLGVI
jgi:hypothetical protein